MSINEINVLTLICTSLLSSRISYQVYTLAYFIWIIMLKSPEIPENLWYENGVSPQVVLSTLSGHVSTEIIYEINKYFVTY